MMFYANKTVRVNVLLFYYAKQCFLSNQMVFKLKKKMEKKNTLATLEII